MSNNAADISEKGQWREIQMRVHDFNLRFLKISHDDRCLYIVITSRDGLFRPRLTIMPNMEPNMERAKLVNQTDSIIAAAVHASARRGGQRQGGRATQWEERRRQLTLRRKGHCALHRLRVDPHVRGGRELELVHHARSLLSSATLESRRRKLFLPPSPLPPPSLSSSLPSLAQTKDH